MTPAIEQSRIAFTLDRVLSGLKYHFRELGLGQALSEGLWELIESRLGERTVYVDTTEWNRYEDSIFRALLLLQISGLHREELDDHPQCQRLLALEYAHQGLAESA